MGDTPLTKLLKGQKAAKQRANEILKRVKDIPNPIVVELGVNHGNLSRELLAARDDLTLYMVDSWLGAEHQPDHYKNTRDRNAHRPQSAATGAYNKVLKLAEQYKGRTHIIKMDTVRASNYFQDESVDLVFIDADHSYEGCISDIESYIDKTRYWIGGHDYKNPQPQFDFSGVDKAVEEIFGEVETGENVTWFFNVKENKCLLAS